MTRSFVRHGTRRFREQSVGLEFEDKGRVFDITRHVARTIDAEAYIACGLAGLGLIQIPAYDVADHIADGSLRDVMPDLRAAPMPIALLYPHRRHLSRRLQIFAEWVSELFQKRILAAQELGQRNEMF